MSGKHALSCIKGTTTEALYDIRIADWVIKQTLPAAYLAKQLRDFQGEGLDNPVMDPIAQALSTTEIEAWKSGSRANDPNRLMERVAKRLTADVPEGEPLKTELTLKTGLPSISKEKSHDR